MPTRTAAVLVVTVTSAVAAVLVRPATFGLAETTGVVQVIALRGLIGVVTGALGLAGAVLALALRRRPSAVPVLAAAVATTCLAVAGTQFGVLLARGTHADPLPRRPADPGSLTVVVANTLVGRADAQSLATLLATVGADVVALPETDGQHAAAVVADARDRGLDLAAFTAPPRFPVSATSLLVAARLGPHRIDPAADGGPGSVAVVPTSGTGPVLAAVHPFPPLDPARTPGWRQRSRQAVDLCRTAADAVVAGDLNATPDHPALQRLPPCLDAGAERGGAGLGTWPQQLPPLLAAPLDHVLATARTWRVLSYSIADLDGSDHRAVVARLARR